MGGGASTYKKKEVKFKRISEFELVCKIGEGAIAKVWKARCEKNDKEYALKISPLASSLSNAAEKRAQGEYKLLGKMKSPFVVQLHGWFMDKQSLYCVLDLLSGGNLFQLQSKQPKTRLSLAQTRFYTMEIFLALDHVHSHNITYRDLKPENLMLDEGGHIVLTDFGLSAEIGPARKKHFTLLGTPEYMAPEIFNEEQPGYDHSVDYWALGCLIYELLHSVSPFSARSAKAMFMRASTRNLSEITFGGDAARALINELIVIDPSKRIRGEKLRGHPLFEGYSWEDALSRTISPPENDIDENFVDEFATFSSLTEASGHSLSKMAELVDQNAKGRINVLNCVVDLINGNVCDADEWEEVLAENFIFTSPVPVWRKFVGDFAGADCSYTLFGQDAFIQDMEKCEELLHEEVCIRGHVELVCDLEDIILAGKVLTFTGFYQSRVCQSRTKFISRLEFDDQMLIQKMDISVDMFSFRHQVEKCVEGKIDEHTGTCQAIEKFDDMPISVADFEVESTIGRGRYGFVWKARSIRHHQVVALKCQDKEELSEKAGGLQQVIQERDLQSTIKHPFIIELLASFQTEFHLFQALEYVNGGTIKTLLEEQPSRTFAEDHVQLLGAEVMLALQHLHEKGVVYRELKLSTLLLDQKGHIRLSSFGTAGSAKTEISDVSSKRYEYVAPETLMHGETTRSSDWWAFGCFLFELLVGHSPFSDVNTIQMHKKIVKGKFDMPESLSGDAQAILKRILVTDDLKRPNGVSIKEDSFFASCDWANILKRNVVPKVVPRQEEIQDGQTKKHESTIRQFFKLLTEHCTDEDEWDKIVEPMVFWCSPNLPFCESAASVADPISQAPYVIGISELAEDMKIKKENKFTSHLVFDVVNNEINGNTSTRLSASLRISSRKFQAPMFGAVTTTFSKASKLNRIEVIYDVEGLLQRVGLVSKRASSLSSGKMKFEIDQQE